MLRFKPTITHCFQLMYAFIAGLATGITYAFNLPTFSRPENVLAYFAIIMMFGCVRVNIRCNR